jgi:chromosome segregation ATPase
MVTAEALLNPSFLEEQLSRRLAGKSSPLPADTTSDDDCLDAKPPRADATPGAVVIEAAETARFQQEALTVFERGADAAVQEELQVEIAKTKKLESELATIKKKVDAAKRQQDVKALEYAKLLQQKEALHQTCKHLIADRERLEKFNAENADADDARREEVRLKFEKDVDSILAKVEEQAAQKATAITENAALTKEFDDLKATFDAMMNTKMSEWKERDEQTRAVVSTLQERMMRHDKLQQLAQAHEAEAENLARGIVAYNDQATMYGERMGDFDSALVKSAEVIELTARREAEFQAEIKRMEDMKQQDATVKRQMEDEAAAARSRIRELRKQLQQLERTKMQAEKKCRAAQDAIRKRTVAPSK